MVMIAEERRKKNLTQKQLAEMMGVANSTLNQWETGLRRPNVDMLVKLARVLGCTPNDILGFEEEDAAAKASERGDAPEKESFAEIVRRRAEEARRGASE